jgi:hypothetical protein
MTKEELQKLKHRIVTELENNAIDYDVAEMVELFHLAECELKRREESVEYIGRREDSLAGEAVKAAGERDEKKGGE